MKCPLMCRPHFYIQFLCKFTHFDVNFGDFFPRGSFNITPLSFQIMVPLHNDQATGHDINHWWASLLSHIFITRPRWFKYMSFLLMRQAGLHTIWLFVQTKNELWTCKYIKLRIGHFWQNIRIWRHSHHILHIVLYIQIPACKET